MQTARVGSCCLSFIAVIGVQSQGPKMCVCGFSRCVRRPQIEQVAMVLAHISDKELKTNEYANFLHYVRVLS